MTIGSFFADYGLFLAEFLTVLALIVLVVGVAAIAARRSSHPSPGLQIEKINKTVDEMRTNVKRAVLDKEEFKKGQKRERREKKANKSKAAGQKPRPRIFLIEFKGDIRASATASLREEISAVLSVANDSDNVLLRLENAGGVVHEHGLAASQLLRLRSRGVKLTVAVDKVAASGGYLMACVADRIIAAPFAIVGSIGVLAQLPNFHRLLESKGVDFEQVTAGRYKRTLTMFGENTEEGRQKLKSELEDIHELFKDEIKRHRPQVDLETVATGEHWYGLRALELQLIDQVTTSDDYLIEAVGESDVYKVAFRRHKPMLERMLGGVEGMLSR